jgi:GH3 auxin-responsive promoter
LQSSDELTSALNDLLDPWFQSLANPKVSQEETLRTLLRGYALTEYGKNYGAEKVTTIEEFRSAFPITDYGVLSPELEKVKTGNYSALLPEPVSKWVMTRGSTGRPKIIPTTETFLSQIFACGARAIVNFALKSDVKVLETPVLNLNFPSEVYSMATKGGEETKYGYSSGTYAKLFPSLDNTGLVPLQEEIDVLGGGVSKIEWERRFDLVFNRAKSANVGSVMGVAPVILSFARHVKRKYGVYPKETWKMKGLFLTSVAKIHSNYGRILRHYFGESVPVIEMYTATEGVFAQQIDSQPYVVPNYDTYFFEVKMGNGKVKMLSELKPNDWGSLIVSSVLFPRYEIGDLIEAVGRGYFRVFGRKRRLTVLEHLMYSVLTWRL